MGVAALFLQILFALEFVNALQLCESGTRHQDLDRAWLAQAAPQISNKGENDPQNISQWLRQFPGGEVATSSCHFGGASLTQLSGATCAQGPCSTFRRYGVGQATMAMRQLQTDGEVQSAFL